MKAKPLPPREPDAPPLTAQPRPPALPPALYGLWDPIAGRWLGPSPRAMTCYFTDADAEEESAARRQQSQRFEAVPIYAARTIVIGPYTLDLDLATFRGPEVEEACLTPTELKILTHLMRHRGVWLSTRTLRDTLCPDRTEGNITVCISHLRRKIGKAAILSRPSYGYRFADETAEVGP